MMVGCFLQYLCHMLSICTQLLSAELNKLKDILQCRRKLLFQGDSFKVCSLSSPCFSRNSYFHESFPVPRSNLPCLLVAVSVSHD